MNYEAATTYLADAVAADPFNMENFRKFGFFAKVAIKAASNNKMNIANNALLRMLDIEDIDIEADVTGVMLAIHNEALLAVRNAVRNAA
jgi:hypothetical protein